MGDNLESDPVLGTLKDELVRRLGGNLRQVWLFGSRARGDGAPDSDYDILIIAEGDPRTNKTQVQDAEWLCMETYGVLVASLVYSPEQWNLRKNSPLGWNILKEGRLVA